MVLVVYSNLYEDTSLHGVRNLDHRGSDGDNAKDHPCCDSGNDYVLEYILDDDDEVSHSWDDWDTSYVP